MTRSRSLAIAAAIAAVALAAAADVSLSADGGGWVAGVRGGRANFGAHVEVRPNGTLRGHVLVNDPSVGFNILSTSITGVDLSVACQATLEGTVAYNSATYTFRATLQDNADPGAGFDAFSINIPADTGAVYSNGSNTILGDGKIQVNGQACATTLICHRPPGNPDNTQQINVSVNAIPAHVAHGDNIGPCVCAGGDSFCGPGLPCCAGAGVCSGGVDPSSPFGLCGECRGLGQSCGQNGACCGSLTCVPAGPGLGYYGICQ